MIELGKWQTLSVVRCKDFGIYLNDEEKDQEAVLLPRKQVPEGTTVGDSIEVFIYKDSEDRLIATLKEPLITMGEIKELKVVTTSPIGAFMDWGLEKDILLPFKEQLVKVKEGKSYLVRMYKDKSERLCVSMKIYEDLRSDSPYIKDDMVNGIIYDIKENLGVFVAVDGIFHGLVPPKEIFKNFEIGDKIDARVTSVRDDGRLCLSLRKPAYLQMDEDSQAVMRAIESYDGVLPFNDKASTEVIQRELGFSKNAFKRAVGRLLKEDKIIITEKSIIKK